MRVYWEIAKKSFQRHLAYRAANVAGILTNTFFGAIYVYIYLAVLRGRGPIGGLDAQGAVTYVVVSQSLLMAMSAFGNRELSEAIIRGDIVIDFIRPLHFYRFWAALDLGRALYYLLLRGIPTFLIGWALFDIRLPSDPIPWLLFVVCLALGMAISFAFRFITSSLAFWITDARGVNYLTSTLILFLSGFIVPVNFFPDRLRSVVEWLPFRSLSHLPINVLLGNVTGAELGRALIVASAWLFGLILIGHGVLRVVTRRLTAHGG